ncbi:hypothetical protein [Agaribacter flavus]|uniref:Uncharacterized protein n=1 Tax=Agaribacter flavus TaxID=1902781 RepID=A0ABV7FPE5_9ALTE
MVHQTFIKTIFTGLIATLFWGGVAVLTIGMLVEYYSVSFSAFGSFLVKVSSAVLGAGVFAAIMKSAQFTEIFQRQIFEVFNNPKKLGEIVDVPGRWKVLTSSRLKDVLPDIYSVATDQIETAFFDDELEYHFENYDHTFDFKVVDGQIKVSNTFDAVVVRNPKSAKSIFLQKFSVEEEVFDYQLEDFFVGNEPIKNLDDYFKLNEDEDGRKHYALRYEIDKSLEKLRIRRTVTYIQSLSTEPYVNIVVGRYIKGGIVSARASEGYSLKFIKSGLDTFASKPLEGNKAEGFKTWTLAKQDDLLLPGTGYILMIVKDKSITSNQ